MRRKDHPNKLSARALTETEEYENENKADILLTDTLKNKILR